MSDNEPKKLAEEFNATLAEFRKQNDARLEAIEKRGHASAEKEAMVDKLNARLDELKAAIDKLDVKAGRPGSPGAGDEDAFKARHRKAFDAYARKGKVTDLEEVQTELLGKSMNAGTDPDGGYLVPDALDAEIGRVAEEASPMRDLCNVITVSNESYRKIFDLNGTEVGWVGETEAREETDTPSLSEVAPAFGEMHASPKVTQKLLDDAAIDIGAYLADAVGRAMALKENDVFTSTNGNGVKKPKGILAYTVASSPAFGQLKQVKSGTNSVIVADKLFDVVAALKPFYKGNARWMMNRSVKALARKLKGSTNDHYLFQENLRAGEPPTLLGFPIVENENMPDAGAGSNSVLFADFKQGYTIADIKGIRILRDPFSAKPYVTFYTTKRVGGGVADSNAIIVHTLGS